MKIKHLILMITAAAAASSLYSCSEEPYVITPEEEYTRNFIKNFGLIDPNQDWNLATQSAVTVKVGDTPANVKAYMKVDKTYYLVANLTNVSGTLNIPFDMPEGTNDILVKINGKKYYTTPGGTVDAAAVASRTTADPGTYGDLVFSQSDPLIFDPKAGLTKFLEYIPEGGINIRKVTSNFSFISKGEPFTIYPVYWNTSSCHILGIYWRNEGEDFSNEKTQDLYFTKSNEITQSKDYKWAGEVTVTTEDCYFTFNAAEGDYCETHDATIQVKPDGTHYHTYTNVTTESGGTFEACNPKSDTPYYIGSVKALQTKGLTIQLPEGVHFGFYLKVSPGVKLPGENYPTNNLLPKNFDIIPEDDRGKVSHIVFSESEINLRYDSDPNNKYLEDGKYTPIKPDPNTKWYKSEGPGYVSSKPWQENGSVTSVIKDILNPSENYCGASYKTFTDDNGKRHTMFAFEDWRFEPDLNDCVFMFGEDFDPEDDLIIVDHDDPKEEDPDIVDEPYHWLLAVEDLGTTDDFDFNDIVIGITSQRTNETTGRKVGDPIVDENGNNMYDKVTFTALAAGGTLPAYVFFGDELLYPDGDKTRAEWHKWFGEGQYNSKKVINTGMGADNVKGAVCTIYFGSKDGKDLFSIKSLVSNKAIDAYKNSEFKIGIDTQDNISGANLSYFEQEGNYFVKPSGPGVAPQMFLIPDRWNNGGENASVTKWQWPVERNHIQSCYSGFKEWVANSKATDWYKQKATTGRVCRPTSD